MFTLNQRILTGTSGFFLDVFRFICALLVFFIHAYSMWFPNRFSIYVNHFNPSHAPVFVFFILSGYVIAHTTSVKNRGGVEYVQARLNRLCSIAVPVLLITALCEYLVIRLDPMLASNYTRGNSFMHYLVTALYLNEIWFFSAAPPINSPFWSMSFEFWFYILFGISFFVKGKIKYAALFLVALIVGPKILAMMFVWLLGCLAYWLPRPSIKPLVGWMLVWILLSIAAIMVFYLPPYPYDIGTKPFYFANSFISNWLISIVVAASFWIIPNDKINFKLTKFFKNFRKITDLTFPLYMLHYPLLILYRAVAGYNENDFNQMGKAVVTVLIITVILGVFLERQRILWIRLFKWLLGSTPIKLYKNVLPNASKAI